MDLASGVAGYYGSKNVCGGEDGMHTIVDALKAYVPGNGTTSTKGVPDPKSSDTSGVAAAAKLAADADEVVMAVGTDLKWAAEGHDATSISFSDGQLALIKACADAAKKPIIVVTLTATPLDLTPLLSNPKIGAILHVGQPSVTVLAVGDLLFGKASPGGRLIQTVYPADYVDGVSIFDMGMRPGPSDYPAPSCTTQPQSKCPNATNPGRTYRFYTGKAVLPFGYGLSYSSFTYSAQRVDPVTHEPLLGGAAEAPISLASAHALVERTKAANRTFFVQAELDAETPLVSYEVKVTNTGTVDADDAVLGFLTPPQAGTNGVPLKTLFGFERVHVKAGQTVSVYLYPELKEFTQVDKEGARQVLAGEYGISFGEELSGANGQGFVTSRIQTA